MLALHRCLLSLQQKAHVSERELRYLWVLVSLNATESVLDVLLEGHPSWKYLQEVQTLLENVQRSLTVSCVLSLVGLTGAGKGLRRARSTMCGAWETREGWGQKGFGTLFQAYMGAPLFILKKD